MIDTVSTLTSPRAGVSGQSGVTGQVRSADRQVQDVFSVLLKKIGREGFASAQPLAETTPLVEALGASWEEWFNEFSSTRYTFVAGSGSPSVRENKTADDLRTDYKQILVKAYENGGYASPESFVKGMAKDELATIQQVHHLADPIQPERLSSEAALNLLIPPDAQVDENGDGLTAVGAAYTIRFPDSNTLSNVRMAWEEATKDLSEQDRMLHVLQMNSQLITSNMHFDENGQYVRSSYPGDADWINPRLQSNFSFKNQADEWLEYLNRFSSQMSPEQYQRDTRFWSAFRENLSRVDE